MRIAKAIVSGVLISAFVSFMLVMVGFLFGVSMRIPGFLTLTSTGGNDPQTDIHFYPYTPIALAAAVTCLIWAIGLVRERQKHKQA